MLLQGGEQFSACDIKLQVVEISEPCLTSPLKGERGKDLFNAESNHPSNVFKIG